MSAVLFVLLLLAILPGRVRLFAPWVPWVVAVALLLPMGATAATSSRAFWVRVERVSTVIFSLVIAALTLDTLVYLVRSMVSRSTELGGLELLASSIGVWVTNVVAFSLLFWQIDRGGPGGRSGVGAPRPDWLFPQPEAPVEEVPPGWNPAFVDYLFLGFSTATAFSATDALPLTPRAKLLMMVESSISLATIVVVASRAINILGS
jgi:hypothetical protein